jgi:LytS/YehU family sensor histidine kinase
MRRRIMRAEVALKAKEAEHARAQLESLQSRVQPHFLFNALNSISSLIRQDPARAERMVEHLARLLRASLDTHQESLVPLHQELRIVRDYLEIQSARFEDRLRWFVEEPGVLGDALIPPFSVQSLVENSVKFAVATRRHGGTVRVSARGDGERFTVAVTDDGPGFTSAAKTPGHGLDNLHTRLLTLYGGGAALDIVPAEPGVTGVTVSLTLPVRAHERLRG